MNIDEILTRKPINGTASFVTSQKSVENEFQNASIDDLLESRARLSARQNEIAKALGLDTSRKRKNFKYRHNKGKRSLVERNNPRLSALFFQHQFFIKKLDFRINELCYSSGFSET